MLTPLSGKKMQLSEKKKTPMGKNTPMDVSSDNTALLGENTLAGMGKNHDFLINE